MGAEGELKKLVIDYLHIKQNQGELMFLRLNAGMILIGKRRIQLVPPGTADFLVIQRGEAIFIELKGERGKLTEAQEEFGVIAEHHGAKYIVARSLEDLLAIC